MVRARDHARPDAGESSHPAVKSPFLSSGMHWQQSKIELMQNIGKA